MDTFTLYEPVDVDRLNAVCDAKNYDDDIFFSKMMVYRSHVKNGVVSVSYTKNGFGRHQPDKHCFTGMNKEVRNYLTPHLVDIDIVNSHPTILLNEFKKLGISTDFFIRDYVENRDAVLKKLGCSKKDILVALYKHEAPLLEDNDFIRFHELLYGDFYNKINKDVRKMLPRAKKGEKYTEASIVSRYIQNIEDKYVMKMIRELQSRKINVVSYIYDGFMCERDDIITDDYLDECVKAIGLPVSFIIKEQRITWEPEIDENEMYCPRKASQYIIASEGKVQKLADNVFIDEAIWYQFVRYCNKYFAYVKKTNMFLFRETVDQPYEILDKKTFLSRTSKSFTLTPTFIGSRWFESGFNSTVKTYTSIEYIVNKKLAQSDKYRNCLNVYVEPEYKPIDHTKVEFKKMFPRVYGYLSFLASGDKQHTEFLIDWIAGACYTGKNCVALGFMGIEGTGKSTFVNMLLSQLLPDGGVLTTSEPDKFVFGNFNGHIQNKHVIQIDECGDKYAHTQSYANKLKTGITSEEMLIHNKFQTPVMCNSNINLVSSSNDMNIYRMNENSRRFVVYNVSKKHRGDFEYFGKLNKEIKSRVLELRGYLRSLAIDRDIEYVHKVAQGLPRTDAMNDLIDLNMPHDKIYCRDELHVHIKKNRGTLKFDDAYALYKMSYENTGRSTKPLPKNYFSKAIKKEGYTTVRRWSTDDSKMVTYVQIPDDTSHLNIPEGPGEHIPDGPTQETRRRNDQYWNEHS